MLHTSESLESGQSPRITDRGLITPELHSVWTSVSGKGQAEDRERRGVSDAHSIPALSASWGVSLRVFLGEINIRIIKKKVKQIFLPKMSGAYPMNGKPEWNKKTK